MKNNKSKRPAIAGNKNKSVSRNFSKPSREGGALNLSQKRDNTFKDNSKIEKIDIATIIKATDKKTGRENSRSVSDRRQSGFETNASKPLFFIFDEILQYINEKQRKMAILPLPIRHLL